MDSLFQHNSRERSEHPSPEKLLLLVDGELHTKEAAQLELHLEACWPCRVKTQKLQEAIADIIEFDEQALTPKLLPPAGWRKFDRLLSQLAVTSGKQSFNSRLFGSLGRFFPEFRFSVSLPSATTMLRYAVVPVVAFVVIAFITFLRQEPVVSASEVLGNAMNAQAERIRSTRDAVVHQKIQVRRTDRNSGSESLINWEIWNDTINSRVRQILTDGNQPLTVSKDGSKQRPAAELMAELTHILATNHMQSQQPLSAESYQSWHNTLRHQRDEIIKSKLNDGVEVITLRTITTQPLSTGQIADAMLVVRAKDWQPAQLRLTVQSEGGNRVYELTEHFSEVVSLADVNAAIFVNEPIAIAVTPDVAPKLSSATEPVATPLNVEPPRAVASANLEIEVTYLLNQIKANLGEQISVSRTAEGQLLVKGIVDTDKRKSEILTAMNSVANNPAVKIDVETVAEALSRQKQRSSGSVLAGSLIASEGTTLPVDSELRRYLGARGVPPAQMDQAIRDFSTGVIGRTRRAMRHAFVLKRLAEQLSNEQVRTLTPEAYSRRLAMFREHAMQFERETRLLRVELEPVFGSSASGQASVDMRLESEADLSRAVHRLFELAANYEKAVGSAFAVSAGNSRPLAIESPQFWNSLRSSERLAELIQTALNTFKSPDSVNR